MKTTLVLMVILLGSTLLSVSSNRLPSKKASKIEAKQIMNNNFISQEEAGKYFLCIPKNLPIPFSVNTLKEYSDYWLMPMVSPNLKHGYEYVLIKPNFSFEICEMTNLSEQDTLGIDMAKKAIYLLCKLRPDFLGRNKFDNEFKLFFRSKTLSEERNKYRQIFSYTPERQKFLLIDWPDNVEIGELNKTFASFLLEKNNKEYLGIIPLPDSPPVTHENEFNVLTLYSVKHL